MTKGIFYLLLTINTCIGTLWAQQRTGSSDNLSIIKRNHTTGFANGGWKYDRYKELQSLDAGTSMVLADLEGPGMITHLHTTRHFPEELFSRGIVLLIYFDGATDPAVHCPLADFFGDGVNGSAEPFSSTLVECAPGSYNAYIPMPFKKSAKVILRNDTDRDAMNYSYVEWEKLPEWDESYGYFHATYKRMSFRLLPDTDTEFFSVKGSGHLIGRQFSVATDDAEFTKGDRTSPTGFMAVMEGNNEVSIDGVERAIDYLGSEDSFTFSWGFGGVFKGLRSGMPFVSKEADTSFLSIFRFHDHMPIRFNKELKWNISWKNEQFFFEMMKRRAAADDGNVDYATVFYWYQDSPGGYLHEPLAPVDERRMRYIKK